ncbi:MAG: GNAT family N-acetyltransferase [Deltaproteobacteria bacterium]|nr:GNAT family N-acetyltransferase [Deltaproteobacteria bacterium]
MSTVDPALEARLLDSSHGAEMLAILRSSPIETPALSLCFDRGPDIFAMSRLKYDPLRFMGLFAADRLVGFAMLGIHQGYVNGKPTRVMHLSDYYVRAEHRGRGSFNTVVRALAREVEADVKLGYAVVLEGNAAALRFMNRDAHRIPVAAKDRTVGTLEARSILVTFRRRRPPPIEVRKALPADVEAIVALLQREHTPRLFAPVLDVDRFRHRLQTRPGCDLGSYYVALDGNEIVGVVAAWDTVSFKQNRVVRYGWGLQLTRVAYGALRPVFGFPRLPAPGEAFRDLHLTDCAARHRSPEILGAILERIYADCRPQGYNTLIFASAAGDPMLDATAAFRCETVRSHIVAFSLDAALLADGAIDTSLPCIDVALL